MINRSSYLAYALVVTLIGMIFLLEVGRETVRVIRVQVLFKEAKAKVLETSVTETRQMRNGPELETVYLPTIKYEYEVGGRRYSSARYWVTNRGGTRAWAERVASTYAVGSEHWIFYDPVSPDYCVLTKEVPEITSKRIATGITGSFICFLCAGLYVRRFRRPQSQNTTEDEE